MRENIVLLGLIGLILFCCSRPDDEDITPQQNRIRINFSHNWDNQAVSSSDFNTTVFTNLSGDTQTISKLKYLISDLRFYTTSGDSIVLPGYNLVDLTNLGGLIFSPDSDLPYGDYTGIGFVFGFDQANNTTSAYPDLNSASWNWPEMIGGGYHFMQFEGGFASGGNTGTYAYHMGTARQSVGVFEQNYIPVKINQNFTHNSATNIDISMNIAEWFKNPYTWDLNTYNNTLMPNYDAQKKMHQNGASVFSVANITP